jgi:hypothetical protein
MAKLRKQISLDFINHAKQTINELLASKIPQSAKYKLCVTIEKLLRDLKEDSSYKNLYWQKYGRLDWDAEKYKHLSKLTLGDTIRIPKEYIVGPEATDDPDFTSDIQGEFSRVYCFN